MAEDHDIRFFDRFRVRKAEFFSSGLACSASSRRFFRTSRSGSVRFGSMKFEGSMMEAWSVATVNSERKCCQNGKGNSTEMGPSGQGPEFISAAQQRGPLSRRWQWSKHFQS